MVKANNVSITFGRVDRFYGDMHTCKITVEGVPVGDLMKDPSAEMPEWYTHDSSVRLDDGRIVDLPDQDHGGNLRRAQGYVSAYIRGSLSVQ